MAAASVCSLAIAAQACDIIPPPAVRVELSPEAARLLVGNPLQLHPSIEDPSGTWGEDDVWWQSSDESVAIVGKTGMVTAVGEGSASITAGVSDIADTTYIIVPPPAGVVGREGAVIRVLGDQVQLSLPAGAVPTAMPISVVAASAGRGTASR